MQARYCRNKAHFFNGTELTVGNTIHAFSIAEADVMCRHAATPNVENE